jgi:hypothetical protein
MTAAVRPINPAMTKFVAQLGEELLLAQVLIRRTAHGYELRHVDDRDRNAAELRLVAASELRRLAQYMASGAFRPLKSAPNLQTQWRAVVASPAEMELALDALYPGAVADWFAAQATPPPLTSFREFTERQTGMYRITAMLNDGAAAPVIRACCHRQFCLKRRLWTVAGLAQDEAKEKSLIPCLEPCAVLLEFARKVTRIEQGEKARVDLSQSEIVTLQAALRSAVTNSGAGEREADFSSSANPRRVQYLLEKFALLDASEHGKV